MNDMQKIDTLSQDNYDIPIARVQRLSTTLPWIGDEA